MNKTTLLVTGLSLVTVMAMSGCMQSTDNKPTNMTQEQTEGSILLSYANIAHANYADALNDAKSLANAINTFASNPSESTLSNAKAAWLTSRESYGTSEIFRLANGPVDAEEGWVAEAYGSLEGQLNAWPLDENMVDYTINAKGEKTSGNIIDSTGMFNPGGEESSSVDITNITENAISALNENGGDANVATGYHAIEFLLWGQDQDYSNFVKDSVSNGAMVAGQRPLTDFTTEENAQRRLAYLKTAAAKIVSDLTTVASAWSKDISSDCDKDATGCYRAALLGNLTGEDASKNISTEEAEKTIFAGMGVFIKSEVANERIAVAVLTPSEEDEHSCFSDNTHRDIATNYQGFKNILMGTYKGADFGSAPIDAVSEEVKLELTTLISKIESKIASIDSIAKTSRHFDYQIQPNDPQARVIVKLKNELRKLGDKMLNVASANNINLSIDDVTDIEETKF